jgi:hypothetical protein
MLGISWGPAYSLGPTKAAIIEAVTTFTPGTPPMNPQEFVFLSHDVYKNEIAVLYSFGLESLTLLQD